MPYMLLLLIASKVNGCLIMHVCPNGYPNGNFLLITSVQTTDSTSYWTDCLVIDLEGKIIQQISENSSTSINFSPNGEYFIYSLDGNLWIDQLQM
jgi:hypothetical protein